jgi:rubrerythrin
MLLAFARAERSSFFDMMEAANRTTDVSRRAAYVRHAVDENRHAQMFSLRALELDPSLAFDDSLARADFEHLFTRLGEERFLAFVHLGERRARAQMALFRDELAALEGSARADTKTKALLDAVMADEERHEVYTRALLEGLEPVGGALRAARWWELRRTWLRMGAASSGGVFSVVMTLVFVLLAPLAALERWRAASRSGWSA